MLRRSVKLGSITDDVNYLLTLYPKCDTSNKNQDHDFLYFGECSSLLFGFTTDIRSYSVNILLNKPFEHSTMSDL